MTNSRKFFACVAAFEVMIVILYGATVDYGETMTGACFPAQPTPSGPRLIGGIPRLTRHFTLGRPCNKQGARLTSPTMPGSPSSTPCTRGCWWTPARVVSRGLCSPTLARTGQLPGHPRDDLRRLCLPRGLYAQLLDLGRVPQLPAGRHGHAVVDFADQLLAHARERPLQDDPAGRAVVHQRRLCRGRAADHLWLAVRQGLARACAGPLRTSHASPRADPLDRAGRRSCSCFSSCSSR